MEKHVKGQALRLPFQFLQSKTFQHLNMLTSLLLLGALPLSFGQTTGQFQPKPGYFPATGDDTIAGGIFCIPLSDLPKYTANTPADATGSESPKGTGAVTSGSGPYPAAMLSDSSLPNHTIYAPKTPPSGNVSMPFISWANGACMTDGSQYRNLLTEIASYGYIIAANGPPTSSKGGQSKVQDSRDSIDWAIKNSASSKYGNIDTSKIASAGHSCGGLEAMSVGYHDSRVKLMMLFDIAIFMDEKRYLLGELRSPVAWLVGGVKDMGFVNVSFQNGVEERENTDMFSLRRIMRFFRRDCLLIGLVLTLDMEELSRRLMEGSLVKLLLRIFSGNSEAIRLPRRFVRMRKPRVVWFLTTGM